MERIQPPRNDLFPSICLSYGCRRLDSSGLTDLPRPKSTGNIPAGWTLCLPMNDHDIVPTLNLESHSTFEHVGHIHCQPDTPRKDQVKPQSVIKPRSNVEIHLKDPLVLVSPRHARTLPFPPPSPADEQRRFRFITPDHHHRHRRSADLPYVIATITKGILTSPGKDEPEPVSHPTQEKTEA